MNFDKNKLMLTTIIGMFLFIGTYNAVVINSESLIASSEIKFIKRLDEVYGVTVPGRTVAASTSWQKISINAAVSDSRPELVNNEKTKSSSVVQEPNPEAAVQEELNLSLVEVVNPGKWENGLTSVEFNGSLATNNGVIESLTVSLPNDQGLSVSFSEMTGNVFEYDLNGELYSGMMYQVDQSAYMVTLTNGPLEGTRLRFAIEQPIVEQQENQQILAENNVEAGTFGDEKMLPLAEASQEQILQNDQQMQQDAINAQGFNFNQPVEL